MHRNFLHFKSIVIEKNHDGVDRNRVNII